MSINTCASRLPKTSSFTRSIPHHGCLGNVRFFPYLLLAVVNFLHAMNKGNNTPLFSPRTQEPGIVCNTRCNRVDPDRP